MKSGAPVETLLERIIKLEAAIAELRRERDAERRRTLSEVQHANEQTFEAIRRYLDGAGLQHLDGLQRDVTTLLERQRERDAKTEELLRQATEALREHVALAKAEEKIRKDVDFRSGHRRAWLALGLTLFGLIVSAITAVATSWSKAPAKTEQKP